MFLVGLIGLVGWRRAAAVAVLGLLVVASGCRTTSSGNNANIAANGPIRQVTDDLGRTVTVPAKVTRVVSLAPNLTENIFAVGAGDRLVGVTTFCNYPEEAKSIAKIGDTMNPNMESIIALKPDVVFVSTASQIETFTKTLEANGIAVYVTNPKDVLSVFQMLGKMGEIFDVSRFAAGVEGELELRVDQIYGKVHPTKQVRVFLQISKEPLFTIGKGSYINELLEVAGGQSVTMNVESAYPKLSKETALALNPEAIILSESDDNKEPNDAFKNSPAVKNGRIYKVNADLLSRPGPRLVDALEQIAKDLHPERFPK